MSMVKPGGCRVCHRVLTNPHSRQMGIGPVCARKLGVRTAGVNSGRNEETGDRYDLPFDPNSGDIICQRDTQAHVSGSGRHFNITQTVVRHSPTGMEWGYGGSGPADFALNILRLFTRADDADRLYEAFKDRFVARLPREGGTIPGAAIKAWLAVQALQMRLEPAI